MKKQTNDLKFKIISDANDPLLTQYMDSTEVYVKPGIYAMSTRKLDSLKRIAMLQKYYQCNPVRFIDDFFNIELIDAQAFAVQRIWNCPNVLVVATRGFGKAVSLDTNIPTPNGNMKIRDIHIGDYVFGDNGKPVKVINESPVFYNHDCYRVVFSDGEEIIADGDHLWGVYKYGKYQVINTRDMVNEYRRYRKRKDNSKSGWEYIYKIDIAKPVEYATQELNIDPYILGLWLGDGCSAAGYITVSEDDLGETIDNIESTGYIVHSVTDDNNRNKRITIHSNNDTPLITMLRHSNLLNNKHIPETYLRGNVDQRLSLLQGLMDTDGTISQNGRICTFVQSVKHKILFDDVVELVTSLGYKTNEYNMVKKCNDREFDSLQLYFNGALEMPVFRLQRKLGRLCNKRHINATHKSIRLVERVDSVPTKCLMVDNESHLFLCGNKHTITHNSTIIDLFLMAKDCLFCNYWAYIASGSGSQAEQTFTTLEKLANDNIDEFQGSTGYIFKQEIEVKNAAGDGFSHGSNGFSYSTYNGSETQTLNSNVDAKRGKRGTVIFDESGFLSEELMTVYGAFAIVNKSFKTGKDRDGNSIDPVRLRTFPSNIPNQKIYISSASSTDTEFYRLYREFAKKMLIGDPDYFVLHVDCEVVIKPLKHGEIINAMLSRKTVDTAMATNPEKARREYYCEFTSDAGVEAIIRRGAIARNSETRVPLLFNDTNDKKFVITYDPARSRDNSVILVMEIYHDTESDAVKGRIVNCINLIDIGKKRKTPMQTPEQIEYLKEVILAYNGDAPDYENILAVLIDAGAGGGGVNIADFLMQNWVDSKGKQHKGLIDKENGADYVRKYPEAIDKIRLITPHNYKAEMFESLIEMINQDCISFTSDYDHKGYLSVFERDEAIYNKAKKEIFDKLKGKNKYSEEQLASLLQKELDKVSCVKTKRVKLDFYEELALQNIDTLKEELVNMVRKKRESGRDSFELTPEKANRMHDDRAYTAAMAAWYLAQKRVEGLKRRRTQSEANIIDQFKIRAPSGAKSFF